MLLTKLSNSCCDDREPQTKCVATLAQDNAALAQAMVHLQTEIVLRERTLRAELETRIAERTWELVDANGALRASEARYHRIAGNAPGMVYQFVLHPDGSVDFPFVSEGCREIYGMEPHEIEQNPEHIIEIIDAQDRPSFDHSVSESARSLLPWKWEGRFRLPSGERKWVQGASRPERLPNGDLLWDGLLMDITPRKRAEEALRKLHDELEVRIHERTLELAAANARLQSEIQQREQAEQLARGQTEALTRTLNLLATEPDLDKFLGQVMATINAQVCAPGSTLWFYDAAAQTHTLHMT